MTVKMSRTIIQKLPLMFYILKIIVSYTKNEKNISYLCFKTQLRASKKIILLMIPKKDGIIFPVKELCALLRGVK